MFVLKLACAFVAIGQSLATAAEEEKSPLREFLQIVDPEEVDQFVPLANFPQVGVAHNSSASLKIWDLKVSHYPLKKGRVTFYLDSFLTKTIPVNSKMELISYINDEKYYNGTVPICNFLAFAKLDCPVQAFTKRETKKYVLQIPGEAEDGKLSFVATVTSPDNQLIAKIGGVVELKNDGTTAEEEATDSVVHNEL